MSGNSSFYKMNRNLNSLTELTEFAPLSPEPDNTGIKSFFSSFFTTKATSPCNEVQPSSPITENVVSSAVSSNLAPGVPHIFRKVGSLLPNKNSPLQSYKDSDMKQYWMPDSVSKECYLCSDKFTTFRRRHHCRICGQIFCSKCCNQEIPGKALGYSGDLRVCTYCCKQVLTYLNSTDTTQSADLRALQEDLENKYGYGGNQTYLPSNESPAIQQMSPTERQNSTLSRKISVGYQEEKFASPRLTTEKPRKSVFLNLYDELIMTLPCPFSGNQLIQWCFDHNKAPNKFQAEMIAQALFDSEFIKCISGIITDGKFITDALYTIVMPEEEEPNPAEAMLTHSNSNSSFHLDLNLEDNTASIRPNKNFNQTTREISENPNILPVHSVQKIVLAYRRDPIGPNNSKVDLALKEKFDQHRNKLLQQMLINENLSLSWANVILPLAEKIIEEVRPDQNIDSFDIRQYVQIKKVDDGQRGDSFVVSGIVCSKNVSHKSMLTSLSNPRILILQCSIVYQRVEGKLLSLEPVIMQETEYLRNVVARIHALKPDIVLVQRNVARLAQESLQQLGITLVLNMKTTVLERIARCTRADLVYSVDVLLNQIHLGSCSKFSVKKLPKSNKTLMFFEGCAFPHKGSTILLRGSTRKELTKVKTVMSFFIYVMYNWKLESSLLMDEQAYVIKTDKTILLSPSDSMIELVANKPTEEEKIKYSEQDSAGDVKTTVTIQKPASQSINDASDPLQAENDKSSPEEIKEEETPVEVLISDKFPSTNFRKTLDDIILSVSPTIKYTVPYLENDVGKKCNLRKYFPENIYWSAQLDPAPVIKNENSSCETSHRYKIELKDPHPFINEKLTETCQSNKVQASLALYRATGARITPSAQKIETIEPTPKPAPTPTRIDSLQPSNHQRLPVLIYICRSSSPGFCLEPCTINMDFYGRNDIPLGSFLEKYCFRRDNKCLSPTCVTPTLEHERWFIHGNGSVCVNLCEIDNRPPESFDERIIMWNWCATCKQVSAILPMSSDTWRLSLAKFLDLRFNCIPLGCKTATCTHLLHKEQVHYFGYNNLVACFIYLPIKLYEICIPSTTLKKPPCTFDKNALYEEVKKWSLMGQEVFSTVLEKLHNNQTDTSVNSLQLVKDQALLKQRVDEIQLMLTDPDVLNNMWNLEDAIVKLKRAIVESINNWNSRLMKPKPKPKSSDSSKSLVTDSVEGTPADVVSAEYVFDSEESEESDVDHLEDSDSVKPKVPRMKAILSQLLPNNVPSLPISSSFVEAQQHHTLALGCSVPVVVYEQETSSMISYALSSFDYQFKLEELRAANENESIECKIPHIDIKFSDSAANFSVKMYFADLFSELRSFSFPEGEEGFIRSLSRCIQWEARGGKSGSNFCKTKDDRFILKEMSRLEMDSFLTFAPNYYNYVKSCYENTNPTLLCKIFGVFKIICHNKTKDTKTKSNLVVMENLFHSRSIKLRFDLKGSLRNRLVDTTLDDMDSDAVLLDENFIKIISESPLYIHPHSKFILMQAINNDTQFLAGQTVMDYSLLLGIDETNMELVVGMIDYIRTFTWDKKLETMVKRSGLLGGQGKLPTIVSPEEYRKRFQTAMDRYFLGVPDKWTGLAENIKI